MVRRKRSKKQKAQFINLEQTETCLDLARSADFDLAEFDLSSLSGILYQSIWMIPTSRRRKSENKG